MGQSLLVVTFLLEQRGSTLRRFGPELGVVSPFAPSNSVHRNPFVSNWNSNLYSRTSLTCSFASHRAFLDFEEVTDVWLNLPYCWLYFCRNILADMSGGIVPLANHGTICWASSPLVLNCGFSTRKLSTIFVSASVEPLALISPSTRSRFSFQALDATWGLA